MGGGYLSLCLHSTRRGGCRLNDDISKFPDKADRSLKAADLLLHQGEAEFAISRAYYGMFYTVEALLLVKGLQFRKHGGVHAAFGEHFVKTGLFHRKYHRWLLDGYDRRILGDYRVGPAITAEESRRTIDQAREFLAEAVKHIGTLREK